MKRLFCCPALELFHCLPLWKTVLFVCSSAFSLSIPTFSLSIPVDNSEATWNRNYKMQQKIHFIKAMASLLTDVVRGCEASDPKLLCIVRKKIPRDSSRENAIIYHKSLHSWQGVVDYMSFSSLPIHEPC